MKYGAKGAAIFFKMTLLVFEIVFQRKKKQPEFIWLTIYITNF